jgi:hypothetical protein
LFLPSRSSFIDISPVPKDAREKERRQEMKEWGHAQIRWAEMEESKRGLLRWHESAYISLSEDYETALSQALETGRSCVRVTVEGRRQIETRLAEIVTLDPLGPSQSEFLINAGSQESTEHLPFEHVFNPEGAIPPPSF